MAAPQSDVTLEPDLRDNTETFWESIAKLVCYLISFMLSFSFFLLLAFLSGRQYGSQDSTLGRWADTSALPHKDISYGINGVSCAVFPIPTLIYYHMLLQMLLWSLSCPENRLSLGWAEGGLRAAGPPRAWVAHVLRAVKQLSNKTLCRR